MDDLTTWLRRQLDEDERVARAAHVGPWRAAVADSVYAEESAVVQMPGPLPAWALNVVGPDSEGGEGIDPADAEHIARHNPARVLAEVDAKRRIMAIHSRRADVFPDDAGGTFDNCCDGCGYEGICDDPVTPDINDCPILRALALPYADRPGYREEGRP